MKLRYKWDEFKVVESSANFLKIQFRIPMDFRVDGESKTTWEWKCERNLNIIVKQVEKKIEGCKLRKYHSTCWTSRRRPHAHWQLDLENVVHKLPPCVPCWVLVACLATDGDTKIICCEVSGPRSTVATSVKEMQSWIACAQPAKQVHKKRKYESAHTLNWNKEAWKSNAEKLSDDYFECAHGVRLRPTLAEHSRIGETHVVKVLRVRKINHNQVVARLPSGHDVVILAPMDTSDILIGKEVRIRISGCTPYSTKEPKNQNKCYYTAHYIRLEASFARPPDGYEIDFGGRVLKTVVDESE
jgi:hypothetical protein